MLAMVLCRTHGYLQGDAQGRKNAFQENGFKKKRFQNSVSKGGELPNVFQSFN
jgi:hypothetical protein